MKFDELIKLKALQLKAVHSGQTLMEAVGEQQLDLPEVQRELKLRQVCAMVTPQLFSKLEGTCDMLSISKRQFITQAVMEAIEKAESIVSEIDPFGADRGEG